MTYVVIDKSNDKVAACFICDDLADPKDFDFDNLPKRTVPMLSLLEALDNEYLKVRKIENLNKNQVFHAFMVGVGKDYLRRGIGHVITQYTAEAAKRLGFSEIIAECTNSFSRRMFEKIGCKESNNIIYKDFEVDKVKYWEQAEEKFNQPKLSLMYLELKDFELEKF
mmetsp:Transcript_53252/g.44658  ORF Transcript_53252/g.44658 Transcript_53252/m.44658 type:complete len:167 (+) Transcript_53252:177-677(+)